MATFEEIQAAQRALAELEAENQIAPIEAVLKALDETKVKALIEAANTAASEVANPEVRQQISNIASVLGGSITNLTRFRDTAKQVLENKPPAPAPAK